MVSTIYSTTDVLTMNKKINITTNILSELLQFCLSCSKQNSFHILDIPSKQNFIPSTIIVRVMEHLINNV